MQRGEESCIGREGNAGGLSWLCRLYAKHDSRRPGWPRDGGIVEVKGYQQRAIRSGAQQLAVTPATSEKSSLRCRRTPAKARVAANDSKVVVRAALLDEDTGAFRHARGRKKAGEAPV